MTDNPLCRLPLPLSDRQYSPLASLIFKLEQALEFYFSLVNYILFLNYKWCKIDLFFF